MQKILILGLPGAGKTTLASESAPRLNAVHFNADDVRAHINKDLGFSEPDRIENARRMGWLCDQVVKVGCFAIADFICPTPAPREAFRSGGDAFVIFMDRIQVGRFPDTNHMFVPPERYDLRVTFDGSPHYWAEKVICGCGRCSIRKSHGTIVGRYQPIHQGHRALIAEGLEACGPGLHRCCNPDRVLVTTYEEMSADNKKFFEKLLTFFSSAALDIGDVSRFRSEATHFRKGEVDEWRRAFSSEQRARALETIPSTLQTRMNWPAL